jgi:hypothetical protein
MKTSDITSQGSRPLAVVLESYYRTKTDDVLVAELNTGIVNVNVNVSYLYSTAQYEFPGDLTYQRYLLGREVGY